MKHFNVAVSFVFVFLFCSSATPLFALDPSKKPTQYVLDIWQKDKGLPQSSVEDIVQTSDGYLWLATHEGLVRFDGVQFTSFNAANTEAMRSSIIWVLFEDSKSNLWIGTQDGLLRLKDGRFTLYSKKDGLPYAKIHTLFEDKDGVLWISGNGPLCLMRNEKISVYQDKKEVSISHVGGIAQAPDGTLWFAGGGLYQLRDNQLIRFDHSKLQTAYRVLQNQKDVLWVGTTKDGIGRLEDGNWTFLNTENGLTDNYVNRMIEDRDGSLWIATTSKGLNRYRNGVVETLTKDQGLSNNQVKVLYEDREGSIWIGTNGGGLDRLKSGNVTSFSLNEGLNADFIHCILESQDGVLWIGTNGQGLIAKEGEEFKAYTTEDGLSHNVVLSLHEDPSGNLWIGTADGLTRFRDGVFTTFGKKEGLNAEIIFAIDTDAEGTLWISSRGGLYLYKEGTFTRLSEGKKSPALAVRTDRQGYTWVGYFGSGLDKFKGSSKVQSYGVDDGLGSDQVLCLHEDEGGILWIGTYGGGLTRLRDGKFTVFTEKEGLFNDVIYQILEDDAGNLWMSSNKGISSAPRGALNDLAAGKIDSIPITSYDEHDGMKNSECNGGQQPAGWKTKDGKLWFPTIQGIVMIDPGRILKNPVMPPVVIEKLQVSKTEYDIRTTAVIPPGSQRIELTYTALSLLDPEKVRFRYMLEGFDPDWIDAGIQRNAHYTNVPPGDYNFRVIASNNDGLWNESGAMIPIRFEPTFFQTYWFYGLCVLGAVLAATGIHRYRLRHLEKRQRELSAQVEERTEKLLRLQHELENTNQNLEIRVQEGIDALREAERMAAYGQMVAGVAHEVRHPISALQATAYVLEQKLKDREEFSSQVGILQRECRRMNTLMEDLLQFSKPSSIFVSAVDPNALLTEAKETFLTEHKAQTLKVVVNPSDELKSVVLDKERILQVMVNLMENALKHAKGITSIQLSAARDEDSVRFKVKNDGTGIPEEHISHLFEPFYTTGKGTGLGLAIVHQIISQHGGKITVESKPESGTAFTFQLPVSGPQHSE